MMNKNIRLISTIIILLSLYLTSCGTPNNWQTVEIKDFGNMKVPENWKLSTKNGFIYFSVQEGSENKNVFAQYSNAEGINPNFAKIEKFDWLQDENFSNSTGVIKNKVFYEYGTSVELYTVYFTGSNVEDVTEFLCLDDSVIEDTLKKIAKSYVNTG